MAFKKEDKYLVVKTEDVRRFLHPNDGEKLEEVLEVIGSGRKAEGKGANSYVVVNEDELYSWVVWRLIEISQDNKEGLAILLENLEVELAGY